MRARKAFAAAAWIACAVAAGVCGPALARDGAQKDIPAAPLLRALIVGGGPDRAHNQVAIESNVRYVSHLLPPRAPFHVLFTDGDLMSENVQFRLDDQRLDYRTPDLPRLDGPADPNRVRAEIDALAGEARAQPAGGVLLYFTGHGSPNARSGYADNAFDLWAGRVMTVRDLASALKTFPTSTPIALVMVQCYSGAFANVLFENGNPAGATIEQHVAGFFAATPQRTAAGCTPEINEADYRDFTSYFFAALSGVDRMGAPVSDADYDRDGRVGMNEAFAYSLLNDRSIDTPVCTSDAFLRRFVDLPDSEIFGLSYSKVLAWAGPAQLVALDGLSMYLNLDGETRLAAAYQASRRVRSNSSAPQDVRLLRFTELARSIVLAHALVEGGNEPLKTRYAELLKVESGNPLR